jgi:FSR family fosmidomycin resistance protein-like MFS transporter
VDLASLPGPACADAPAAPSGEDSPDGPSPAGPAAAQSAAGRDSRIPIFSRRLLALALGHLAVDCCSGIWPVFKTVAQLDIALAGLVMTVANMAGNGLQLAFGAFADRGARKRLLVVGVASASLVTLVPWAVGSYALMALLVMASQIGSAAFHPSAAGAVTMLAPRRAGFMLGLFLGGGYAGYAISQFVFSGVYGISPLLTPSIAVLPLAGALAIALWVPRSRRAGGHDGFTWAALRGSLRPLSTLFAVQVCASTVNVTTIFLLPDLLLSRHASRWMVEGGGHFALVAGSALALLPAGHASDRWGARRVLALGNLLSAVLLAALLSRSGASLLDLLLVLGFGTFNGVNSVVSVSEAGRVLPGHASATSALLMGMPWFFAALGPVIAGHLADPTRGGTPTFALAWFALLLPLAFLASLLVRTRQAEPRTRQPSAA